MVLNTRVVDPLAAMVPIAGVGRRFVGELPFKVNMHRVIPPWVGLYTVLSATQEDPRSTDGNANKLLAVWANACHGLSLCSRQASCGLVLLPSEMLMWWWMMRLTAPRDRSSECASGKKVSRALRRLLCAYDSFGAFSVDHGLVWRVLHFGRR